VFCAGRQREHEVLVVAVMMGWRIGRGLLAGSLHLEEFKRKKIS